MLVSVVIPAYNEEKRIGKTLTSVSKLLHPDFDYEIIVVDASSSDKTREMAKQFGAKVVTIEKKTVSYSRQKGFEAAKGEIIASLDADTLITHDWLQIIVKILTSKKEIVGVTGAVRTYESTPILEFWMRYVNSFFNWFHTILGFPLFSGQNFAVKKAAFEKVRGFNTEYFSAEDMDLSLRLRHVGKIVFEPKMVVFTSARRAMGENKLGILLHAARNYIKVLVLNKKPETFADVR